MNAKVFQQHMYQIRPANSQDPIYLMNCDLRSVDDPWDNETWDRMAATHATSVATFRGTPIGFAVFVNPADERHVVHLRKLCVIPQHRGRGVGRLLFKFVKDFASVVHAKTLDIVVPEYLTDPRAPFGCVGWLKEMGLRAVLPLVKDAFVYLGQPEDGIRFVCEVNNEN